MPSADETTVVRDEAGRRYELVRDGEVLGYCAWEQDADGRVVLPHTVIDPAYNGQGLGTVLVRGTLEDLARRGETVVPECPFVARFLARHEVPGLTVHEPDAV